MNRTRTKIAQWMGFILLIWLTSASAMYLAGAVRDFRANIAIENPLGDMEDSSNESETENDKESDEDNLYEEKSFIFELNASLRINPGVWDRIHEDPFHNLTSPPPKFS